MSDTCNRVCSDISGTEQVKHDIPIVIEPSPQLRLVNKATCVSPGNDVTQENVNCTV